MADLWYLFAAFFVTWLILGVYLFTLRRQVDVLRSEIAALRGEQQAEGKATTTSDSPSVRDAHQA